MIQALEQMLEIVPSLGITPRNYATIDVFTGGYSQMDHMPGHYIGCTCPLCDMGRMEFERQSFEQSPVIVPYGQPADFSEVKDTFKIDSYESPCVLDRPAFEMDGFGFQPAQDFGIGPGIAREMPDTTGLIERFRYDQGHQGYPEPHLNYEIIVPGIDRKPIIDNFHISDVLKIKY